VPGREHPAPALQRPGMGQEPRGGCACTATVPCALHYAELPQQERLEVRARVHVAEGSRSGDRPRPSRRPTDPVPEDRRFFCKTCHVGAGGPSPPDGWYRIQQADLVAEREVHYLFQTRGLFCSSACLLAGAARIAESQVASPEHAARLHQLAEAARL
jgi:hypothetical protein